MLDTLVQIRKYSYIFVRYIYNVVYYTEKLFQISNSAYGGQPFISSQRYMDFIQSFPRLSILILNSLLKLLLCLESFIQHALLYVKIA